jgi:shikimate kinase
VNAAGPAWIRSRFRARSDGRLRAAVFLGRDGRLWRKARDGDNVAVPKSTVPQPVNRSVFLVGPMGAGKTAVGRALARRLGLPFADSDAEVESRTGVDIAYIFEREGEEGFRIRERDVIDALTRTAGIVLATGGGAILLPENRERLAARGTVVYLDTTVEQQLERTRRGRHRPLLAAADRRAKLEELAGTRDPLYRSIAAITIRTDGRVPAAVASAIARALEQAGNA